MMRKTMILAGLGALAVAAWLAHTRASPPELGRADVRPSSGRAPQRPEGMLESEPSGSRLSALESRVRELEAELSALGDQGNGTDARGDPDRATDADSLQRLDPAEEAALNDRKIAHREEALRAEPVDPTWSRQTEDLLAQAFKDGSFRGSGLRGTHCGTTFCVMVVRHDDTAAQRELERLIDAVYMSGEFIVRSGADGAPETTAYFIRQSKDSPEHAVRRRL